MISFRKYALGLAVLLVITAGSTAQAQTGEGAIYGVTNLDVAPGATNQAIALLKQYRDAALKQAGNAAVILLQEAGWPNRFVIYETWNDQSAYDTNEKAAHTAEFRDRLKPIAAPHTIGATITSSPLGRSARRREAIPFTCRCISTSFRPDLLQPWRPSRRWRRPRGRAKAIYVTMSSNQ